MEHRLVEPLIESGEQKYLGRLRTYRFFQEYLGECCPDLPMKLVPIPLYNLPPSFGWDFVEKNKLEWVIDSTDDEGIVTQFLRSHLPDVVKKGLESFLRSRIPGPLVLEGIFAGEDMGFTPPIGLFNNVYVMDADASIRERVHRLEQAIKSIWAKVFVSQSKKFMMNLELPVEDWMLTVALSVPQAPRRGSFYYPDITCAVMGGMGMRSRGFVAGGWWEPSHPHFPTPVPFTPGDPVGYSTANLLALEAKGGIGTLTRISSHLAKTHGTMNLPVIQPGEKVADKSSRHSVMEGEGAPFSQLTAQLIENVSAMLGEPVTLHLSLQPNSYTGEYEVFLNSVRTVIPKKIPMIMPKPLKHNVDYIFDTIPARGDGSGFARYIIEIDKDPSEETMESIHRYLNILTCEGESAIIIAPQFCNTEKLTDLGSHYSVLGVCSPECVERLPHRLFQINVPFTLKNMDSMLIMQSMKGTLIRVSAKPIKIVVEKGLATAWL
ncbi:hypothetical protein KKF84_17145 [Myxococcota bacterium]|nr:hypothetical protein [Myxococcota bacterium]MBU1537054.1 hypothetical protein [Myxococcota bacterium]